MKFASLVLIFAAIGLAQTPGSNADGKEKTALIFDRELYVMKFVDQTKVVRLNEYYLREETPQNWTKMFSLAVYFTKKTPGEMARAMEAGLLQQHPDAPHDLVVSPSGDEALFMCLNWAGDRQTTSEYDVFRFQKHPEGVLGYQASLRPYQAKITPEDFKALRERWAKKIQAPGGFPPVVQRMP